MGGREGGIFVPDFIPIQLLGRGGGGGKDSYLSNFNLNIQNIWTKFGIMKCYFSFFLIYFNAFYYIFKKFIIIVVLKRWCKGGKIRVCLLPIFKNCFLLLKIKNTKSLFRKDGVFLFLVFYVFSKIIFFWK